MSLRHLKQLLDEYRAAELKAIHFEEHGNPKEQIAAVERQNAANSGMRECAERIMAEARDRHRERRRIGQHRRWNDRITGREAAMRERRSA